MIRGRGPAAVLTVLLSIGWPAAVAAQDCEFPAVLVLLDKSSSMLRALPGAGGSSLWDVAKEALHSLVDEHGDAIHFGLMPFPPRAVCAAGEVTVPIGAQEADAFVGGLPDPIPGADTPMFQSLEAARNVGALRSPDRRNYVLLLTDGWQYCDDRNNAADRNKPAEAVAALLGDGIETFVVGFGDSVDVRTLNRAADAGGHAREGCDPASEDRGNPRNCYFQADHPDELRDAVNEIGRQIAVDFCDGLDNDCDGEVDEGLFIPCRTACGDGQRPCDDGEWGACSVADPEPESCNGRDDDCDGRVDEGVDRQCNSPCGIGREVCGDGRWGECDAPAPQEEDCGNDLDDDCDGVVNEGCECAPGEIRSCGIRRGRCEAGTQTCVGGRWDLVCEGGLGPEAEECDGIDNDCDGLVDGMTRRCQTVCGGGQEVCEAGAWVGCSAPSPVEEVCDGADQDCDGVIDDGLTRPCETACGVGTEACEGGEWLACSARQPVADEICGNAADDDCDGEVDEACECDDGESRPCGPDNACGRGSETCSGGAWGECRGGDDGEPEVCNGLDDNCDAAVDEGDLCPPGERCGCGGCAIRCVAGECDGGAKCIRDFCIVDHCPEGLVCRDSTCVPGAGGGDDLPVPDSVDDDEDGDVAGVEGGGTPSTGCTCALPAAADEARAAWWWPALRLVAGRRGP